MKISKKAYYGLRAVLTLAQTKEPLSIHSLAQAEHLPEDYLEKILQILRRAGVVEAHKGATGGYVLKQTVDTLTVWDVLRVLDGPIKVFAPTIKGSLPCLQPSHCQTNRVLRELERQMERSLSRMNLRQLAGENGKLKIQSEK